MAIKMKKVDGTYSLTMLWNVALIVLTSLFAVAIETLPQLQDALPELAYVLIAIFIKGVDIALRQITTLPMDR